jgi:flagellar L-ring protein precursor FlgH
MKKCIVLLFSSILFAGCSSIQPYKDDPNYAPVMPEMDKTPRPDMGSLYYPHQSLSLYEDIKAHRVGDLITVVLNEQMTGTKSSDSDFEKKSTATIADPTIVGTTPDFGLSKILPIPLSTTDNLNLQTAIDAKRKFEGDSSSSQSNQLSGTITVTVTKVYPNGNLYVRGEKWIQINHGDEFVRISGIVRPSDVTPENTIESHRIADARISYSGKGALADANNPGWLMKIINSPFWPL